MDVARKSPPKGRPRREGKHTDLAQGASSQDFKPLIGTEESSLDDKGRVLFSKKKRERLGSDFLVVLGKLNCVILYPGPIYRAMIEEALRGPVTHPAREDYTRLLLGMATDEVPFDPQNRLVIPREMRREAKLMDGDKVLVMGCGDRVEVWCDKEWAKFSENPSGYGENRRKAFDDAFYQHFGLSDMAMGGESE
jgi:division/cell wall cluster transcriptional repressor MraZ